VPDRFPLTAQVVMRCISKVADGWEIDRKTKRTFHPHGAMTPDKRIRWSHFERHEVSIWTMDSHQRIPFAAGARQLELLRGQRGASDLCYIQGKFYLFAACAVETPEPIDVEGVLGTHPGIVNIASDSDGENFSGSEVDRNRRSFTHRRGNLQEEQTKSAIYRLKKLSANQARFLKHPNHVISPGLVQTAQDTCKATALEALSGVRKAPVSCSQICKQRNSSFYQLRQSISYRSEEVGIPLVLVDQRHTGRICPEGGCVDKADRVSQSLFSCVSCGYGCGGEYPRQGS